MYFARNATIAIYVYSHLISTCWNIYNLFRARLTSLIISTLKTNGNKKNCFMTDCLTFEEVFTGP